MISAYGRSLALLALAACQTETGLRSRPLVVDPVDVLPCGFTPLSGTKMSVYDCNPVFTSVDEAWSDGVGSVAFRTQMVLGHPVFQVWYSSPTVTGSGGWGLGYAISNDGITWTPHPDNPVYVPPPGWDEEKSTALSVAYNDDDDVYALAYQGSNGLDTLGIGVIQSTNGVQWSAPEGGSLLIDTLNGSADACWPLGLSWNPSQGYAGYIAMRDESIYVGEQANCEAHRYRSETLSRADLQIAQSPALAAGPEGYDASGMTRVATVELQGTYYMFYVGFRSWQDSDVEGFVSPYRRNLALATSTDGQTWTKARMLPVALTAPGAVSAVAAQVIGERIHVWVTDDYVELEQRGIGYYLFEPSIAVHP